MVVRSYGTSDQLLTMQGHGVGTRLHSLFANGEQPDPAAKPPMSSAKSNPQRVLRPQDLLVLLRLSLVGEGDEVPPYAALAADLGLTASEVHAAVAPAVAAQLAAKDVAGRPRVRLEALRLFVQHGARYCFPATRGPQTRGVATGYAEAPLNALIRAASARERALAIQLLDERWASGEPTLSTP